MATPTPSASSTASAPITLKLLLIGSSSVGKSSVLLRFTEDAFLSSDEISSTIGVDFKLKIIDHKKSGKRFKLSIWDTAGQERFRTLTSSYYRGAHGVILMYDISNRETFDALSTWFTELSTFSSPNVIKYLVGNKSDRSTSSRVVSTKEAQSFATSNGCAGFKEVSAKRNEGILDVFDELVDSIVERPELYTPKLSSSQQQPNNKAIPGGYPGTVNLGEQEQGSWGCRC